MRKIWLASLALTSGLAGSLVAPGCGGNNGSGFGPGGSANPDGSVGQTSGDGGGIVFNNGDGGSVSLGGDGGSGSSGQCTNLQCQQHTCSSSGTATTISGTIYDPAGKNPLYDVVVYVPNTTPSPLGAGVTAASCGCDSLYTGNPVVSALTDASGKFTLTNAPDGADIPLVVQVGKWRTQLKIPKVTQCAANDLDTLLGTKITLPGKSGISTSGPTSGLQQDIPNIAVSTGSADSLECLLRRVGVDASEYVGGTGTGHVHIYQGCDGQSCKLGTLGTPPNTATPGPASDQALWDTEAHMAAYDIVLLSCEGTTTTNSNSPVLADYVSAGGRVFAEHWHESWFWTQPIPILPGSAVAPFPADLATWQLLDDGAYDGGISTQIVQTLPNGQPFPKGVALASWLQNVGALTNGELPITVARGDAVISSTNTLSQAWIKTDPSVSPASTQYFSFDMPFNPTTNDAGEPNYCGRVVFSDLHVGAAANDYNGATASPNGHTGILTTPDGCTTGDLSPDEKALEFMLFDLSSCVTPVGGSPTPPPPEPK